MTAGWPHHVNSLGTVGSEWGACVHCGARSLVSHDLTPRASCVSLSPGVPASVSHPHCLPILTMARVHQECGSWQLLQCLLAVEPRPELLEILETEVGLRGQ